jgi:hypothetical protein
MFEAYFEAQQLCFCEFWQFEGVEGEICADVQSLMHKNFIFVGFGSWKVKEVKCVQMLNVGCIF